VSKMKNISRAGWVIVGLVAALLLVPTMAVAATVTYNGIVGANGNKANVSYAGQLLTTPALPSKYEQYLGAANSEGGFNGGSECALVTTVPTADAFIVQDVEVDVAAADAPTSYSGPPNGTSSQSRFFAYADSGSQACNGSGDPVTSGDAPGGTVGNVNIPMVPGYVIPGGYSLEFLVTGMSAFVWVTGYLVAKADAPSTPQTVTHGAFALPSSAQTRR
jgi:hypothetical protein